MSGSDWIAHSREAGRLMSQGHATEAIAIYQKIARSQPRIPQAVSYTHLTLPTNREV